MNTTTLAADAEKLGIKVTHGDGRVRMWGTTGAVKKAFAMQGLSAERGPNEIGWYMLEDDGTPVASVCEPDDGKCYAFTFNGGHLGGFYVG